nr:hypothetical protein [Herbaspirillum sp. B39]
MATSSESPVIEADERQERDQIVAALTECKCLRKAWRTARRQADVNSTLLDKP